MPSEPKAEEAKLLGAVRDALERNAQEIKALKEQYAKDMTEQRKKVEAQQQQIQSLEQSARMLQEQLHASQAGDRQQKLSQIQQKQLGVLEEQSQLVADQLEKQAPAVEKLQTQTATLESRSKRAALRDRELGDSQDALRDIVDSQQRNPPPVPAPLKQWYLPSGTNVTPISFWNTITTSYTLFPNRGNAGTLQAPNHRGGGAFSFDEYTLFGLVQLNKRFLLSAETTFTQGGVALGQAQVDMFINDWLTADVGYFLTPIGFWSERLDPRGINKLPDIPLVMRQVIPDGLTTTGLQFRGARYVAGSPVKFEYSAFVTNGLALPGTGQASDFTDLSTLVGTTSGVNNAVAWGGRIGLWLPARGINFGVSEFVNSPYSWKAGVLVSVWQPYFNYRYGNWDVRFEYGHNYEQTKPYTKDNINRIGLYAQVAYRDYQSIQKHRQRLEYVFRFSDALFHGINQSQIDPTAFSSPMNAPVDRNQYTIGLNYYFYASTFLKVAYEFNDEIHKNLRDNVFLAQFSTNF